MLAAASQAARLKQALELCPGGITTAEIRRKLDIPHPAARVQELREAGHNIHTYWTIDSQNPAGQPHRFAKYVLHSEA